MAQSQTSSTTPSRSEFVKVEGGGAEQTSAEGTVVVAYLLMLTIMVVFVWRTLSAQKTLLSDAARLVTTLNKGAGDASR
jgi:hypothetical protein